MDRRTRVSKAGAIAVTGLGRVAGSVALALALMSSSWLSPARSEASPGQIDSQFGQHGFVFSSPALSTQLGGVEVVSSPSGAPTVAFENGALRLHSDGSRDPSFGTNGIVRLGRSTASEGVKQRAFVLREIASDSRGRLLVFGEQTDSRRAFFAASSPILESKALVLRLTPRGNLDTRFGRGKGFIRADFGLGSDVGDTDVPMVSALAGTTDSMDRPVLVAGVSTVIGGCYGKATTASLPRAVVRLTRTGNLDRSFGNTGLSPVDGSDSPPSVAVDGADRPLISVGRFVNPTTACSSEGVLIRMNGDGQPLGSFGVSGARVVQGYSFAVLESSGDTILSRRNVRSIGVVRLRRDGSRDPSFGGDGVSNAALPSRVGSHMRPVAVDSKGRILIAGFIGSRSGRHAKHQPKESAFIVARLLANGELDKSFGTNGRILTRFARPLELIGAAASLDAQGRLLVAGRFIKPGPAVGIVVARYLLGS